MNELLRELKHKLNTLASSSKDCYISVGLYNKYAGVNNIIRADEISIMETEIDINSNNFGLNFAYGNDLNVEYDGISYLIHSNNICLHVDLLGA